MGEDKERREALQRWGHELECEVFVLRARLKLALDVIDAARQCQCGSTDPGECEICDCLAAFDRHTEELEATRTTPPAYVSRLEIKAKV